MCDKHPSQGGLSFPRGAGAEIQNSTSEKLCPMWTHRTYVPSFIDVSPVVLGFENVDTAWMDACMDGHFTGFTSHLNRDV